MEGRFQTKCACYPSCLTPATHARPITEYHGVTSANGWLRFEVRNDQVGFSPADASPLTSANASTISKTSTNPNSLEPTLHKIFATTPHPHPRQHLCSRISLPSFCFHAPVPAEKTVTVRLYSPPPLCQPIFTIRYTDLGLPDRVKP